MQNLRVTKNGINVLVEHALIGYIIIVLTTLLLRNSLPGKYTGILAPRTSFKSLWTDG